MALIPPSASGLHVVQAAGVLLGVLSIGTRSADLVRRVKDDGTRARIKTSLAKNGLVEKEMRALARACGLLVYRPNAEPLDPYNLEDSDNSYWAALIGDKAERRYVLVLKHNATTLTIADPAGAGIASMSPDEFSKAWRLAARKGVSWAGMLWTKRAC